MRIFLWATEDRDGADIGIAQPPLARCHRYIYSISLLTHWALLLVSSFSQIGPLPIGFSFFLCICIRNDTWFEIMKTYCTELNLFIIKLQMYTLIRFSMPHFYESLVFRMDTAPFYEFLFCWRIWRIWIEKIMVSHRKFS